MDATNPRKRLFAQIREVIAEKLARKRRIPVNDPVYAIVGIGSSCGKNTARDHDAVLYGEKH